MFYIRTKISKFMYGGQWFLGQYEIHIGVLREGVVCPFTPSELNSFQDFLRSSPSNFEDIQLINPADLTFSLLDEIRDYRLFPPNMIFNAENMQLLGVDDRIKPVQVFPFISACFQVPQD